MQCKLSSFQGINPGGKFKVFWDLLIGILLMYTAVVVPLYIAFEDQVSLERILFDMGVDFVFLIDVVLSFFTSYTQPVSGATIQNVRKISALYIKGWFWMDLLASLPWQAIEMIVGIKTSDGSTKLYLRVLRIVRLLRLLKYIKLVKFKSKKHCLRINDSIRRIIQVTGLVLFFSHLVACLWFLLARLDDFGPQTWVTRRDLEPKGMAFQYLVSYYWAIQTVTTVGFGDFPARTAPEMVLSLLWMIFGVGFYSYVMGNFSSMLSSLDSEEMLLRTRLEVLEKFVRIHKIPETLAQRLHVHIEQNLKNQNYRFQKSEIIHSLPPTLKGEVMRHTHGHIIEKLILFRQPDTNFSSSPTHATGHSQRDWNFTWRALPLFQSISFAQYEILYREGDVANECYFILQGCVVFSTRTGKPYRKILPGMHFGQISILKDQSRTENAIAASTCDLLTLSKPDFLQLLSEFPEIAREIREEANEKRDFLKVEKDQVKRSNARPVFRNILASVTLWQLNEPPSDNESVIESVHSNKQPPTNNFSELDLRQKSISCTQFPKIKESYSSLNAPRQISILANNPQRRDSFEIDEMTVDKLLEMKGSTNSLLVLSKLLGQKTSTMQVIKQSQLQPHSTNIETAVPSQEEEFASLNRNLRNERRKSRFKPNTNELNSLQDLSEVLNKEPMNRMANLLDDMVEVLKLSNEQQANIAEELGGIRKELSMIRAQKLSK